jgi:hypothetical protein
MTFLLRVLASGALAGAASALVAAACRRAENRHAARSINAIAHIYDGGPPRRSDGERNRNTWVGLGLHLGASLWWATFFEALFGRTARRSTRNAVLAGGAMATTAYVVDYGIVSRRFRPGFEHFLSWRSMFAIYASIAAAFALSARLSRLEDHQVEDRQEGEEGGDAERRPEGVITPVERR